MRDHAATATRALSTPTYVLGVGAFAVGISAFVMSGLLVSITAALRTSPAVAGQLTTVFTVVCAVSGPIAAIGTARWPRRRLLSAALGVCGLGEGLSAIAPTFGVLALAQGLAALGAATYLPTAAAVATTLNQPEQRARATAAVFTGVALALLLGVPAGAALADPLGFHAVFGLLAALCVTAAGGVAVSVPAAAATPPISLRARYLAAVDRPALGVLAVTLMICASTGVLYTYLAAWLAATLAAGPVTISVLLAAYGLGGVAGNTAGGRLADRVGPARAVLLGATGCAVLLATFSLLTSTVLGAGLLIAAWAAAYSCLLPALASWLVALVPTQPGLLLPLGSSAIYLGRGCGGLLGGVLISGSSVTALLPAATALAATALALAATHQAPPRPAVPARRPQLTSR
jgi:predicted MFS family arabinose efflux permease